MKRLRSIALIAMAALSTGCSPAEPARVPSGLRSPFAGYASPRYRDPRMWLCRPDSPGKVCHGDLTTTELRADGSRVVVRRAPLASPKIDCFYVYPTVDGGFWSRNHTDFRDLEPMSEATLAQAANFAEVCALYVPLYRQITLGTYLSWESRRERFLDVAFSDVEDAFLHYMGQHNRGRRVALIGHSQGAEMVVRLLRKRFDADPAMRERLVVAMPIGGRFEVAQGRTTGGTLENIPICTADDEPGCVVAYRTHRAGEMANAGVHAPSEGYETACVSPAGSGLRTFSRPMVPMIDSVRSKVRGVDDVTTPFVAFPGLYAGRCVNGLDGYRYLEVRLSPQPGDRRRTPIDLDAWVFGTSMGLHTLDFQFPQGELADLVRRKAAASAARDR
jgi:hypothetical protein